MVSVSNAQVLLQGAHVSAVVGGLQSAPVFPFPHPLFVAYSLFSSVIKEHFWISIFPLFFIVSFPRQQSTILDSFFSL